MNCVSATKNMQPHQLASVTLDCRRQLDEARCRPVLRPDTLGRLEVVHVEVVVAACSGECCTHLRVGEPARQGSITTVPQLRGDVAACLLDQQLHEAVRSTIPSGFASLL